jgi:hypothetical protein
MTKKNSGLSNARSDDLLARPIYENEVYHQVFELMQDAMMELRNMNYWGVAKKLEKAMDIAFKYATKSV